MTLQRVPLCAATTLNVTGARSRVTRLPERSWPVSVPSATTPLAVARKWVIFALIESVDDGAALADAGTANAAVAASTASTAERDLMAARYPPRTRRNPAARRDVRAADTNVQWHARFAPVYGRARFGPACRFALGARDEKR